MTTPTLDPTLAGMLQRIRDADVYELSFAYCRYVGLPWLSWPLGRMPYTNAQHVRDVVAAVAQVPVCKRTPGQCYAELKRIDNDQLRAVLARIPEAEER